MNPILIVDDEKDNLEALQRLLRTQYQVTTSTSPFEALKLIQKHDFHVIVSDQRMPEMTGVELLEKAKQVAPRATRILLTGYTDIESVIGAINRGNIYRYIAKPWDNEDLKLTLRQADEAYLLRKQVEEKNRELETANQELNVALDELRALDRAKAKFLSLISHELNTPLTVLSSFSGLLVEKKAILSADLQKAVTAVAGASDRFSEIVGEVLSYVKLEADKNLTHGFKNTELGAENETALTQLAKLFSEKKLRVAVSSEPELFLRADAEKLQLALRRLLEDCGRRAPNGSEIKVRLFRQGKKVVYSLSRSGEPLTQDAFNPFVPEGKEMHHQRNLGLGLAMCKLIVESHNGEVVVDSKEKSGSTIQFLFPAAATKAV